MHAGRQAEIIGERRIQRRVQAQHVAAVVQHTRLRAAMQRERLGQLQLELAGIAAAEVEIQAGAVVEQQGVGPRVDRGRLGHRFGHQAQRAVRQWKRSASRLGVSKAQQNRQQ